MISSLPEFAFFIFPGVPLRKLPIDSFTLSEIIRLHFVSSGAKLSSSTGRFRYQQRGGYTEMDDPGLDFSMHEQAILKSLATENVFDLSPGKIQQMISRG